MSEEKKEGYSLINTNLPTKGRRVSTLYRRSSSAYAEIWYFETIVFNYEVSSLEPRGVMLIQDSGRAEAMAFAKHLEIVNKLINDEPFEEED